jgi:molecular chaperone GrpE
MADSRRKSGAGHDRPLHDAPDEVGAGLAPPLDDQVSTGEEETGGGVGLAPPDELQKRVADLEERLARAEAERDERLNDLRRVAADFDNFRKRAARDQENLVARAHERLMKALLPVLDDLERALVAAAEHEEAKLHEGVELVARELREAVKREGLEEIEAEGQFDPHVHEALLSQPSEREEGAVIEVLQKGYRLGDRVLRPARVVISQGVPQEAESE